MVYEPREDSALLAQVVRERAQGACIDIGCGSGVLSLAASSCCESVLGVDIDPAAVRVTQEAGVPAVESDLFSAVHGVFDTIIANTPYLPTDPAAPDVALDGGTRGFEWTLRFLDAAADHLSRDGHVLFLISSLTNPAVVEQWLLEHAFSWDVVARKKQFFEELLVYDACWALPERPGAVFVARGKRSRVYRDGDHAVKLMEPRRVMQEALMLQKANRLGIGPAYRSHEDGVLVMEFVDGVQLKEYLQQQDQEAGVRVLRDLVSQLRALDDAGIEKKEMRNPYKHVIVRSGKPVLIDWERARMAEKTHNLSAFQEYLKYLSKDASLSWIADTAL